MSGFAKRVELCARQIGNNHILYLLTKKTRCRPKVTASISRQTTGEKAAIVDSNYKPISN